MITAARIANTLAWSMVGIWAVFLILFLISHPRGSKEEARRAPAWWIGLLVQALGYLAAVLFSRPFGTPHSHVPLALEAALAVSSLIIAVASVWLVMAAVRELGRHFAVAARVIHGHELITTGPFEVVRHPIYSGFLGLLISTSVAFSTWIGVIVSVSIYLIGTELRIRKEERLLRETFGASFDEYASGVPALIPGLF